MTYAEKISDRRSGQMSQLAVAIGQAQTRLDGKGLVDEFVAADPAGSQLQRLLHAVGAQDVYVTSAGMHVMVFRRQAAWSGLCEGWGAFNQFSRDGRKQMMAVLPRTRPGVPHDAVVFLQWERADEEPDRFAVPVQRPSVADRVRDLFRAVAR